MGPAVAGSPPLSSLRAAARMSTGTVSMPCRVRRYGYVSGFFRSLRSSSGAPLYRGPHRRAVGRLLGDGSSRLAGLGHLPASPPLQPMA